MASAAITSPNQRLRMLLSFPAEAGHEVAHDLLEYGRVEPVADVLPLPLRGDEVGRLEHAEVMRHRRKGHRELLGDLARCPILLGQELEDLAARRVGQGTEQGVVHWHRHLYNCLNIVKLVD